MIKKDNFENKRSDLILLSQKKRYFLGDVVLRDMSKIIGASDAKVYHVSFNNGARTKMHLHEGGQILIVMAGRGVLALFKKYNTKSAVLKIKEINKSNLKKGDVVYISKNTLHWHGAANKQNFVHVAFNAFTSKGRESKTVWYDSDFRSYAKKIK